MMSIGKPTVAQVLRKDFKPKRQKTPKKAKYNPICPFCRSTNSRAKKQSVFRKCKDCGKLFIQPNTLYKII